MRKAQAELDKIKFKHRVESENGYKSFEEGKKVGII